MIVLKSITSKSWLIQNQDTQQSMGVISSNPDGSYFMLFGDQKVTFRNKEDLKEILGFDIFQKVDIQDETDVDITNYINGYPVDYTHVYPMYDHPNGLPTFTKTEESDTIYCAGYFCVKREKGWARTFCSKLDTINKYEYTGPYKTATECKNALTKLKRQERNRRKRTK